jgi:hypothetical protein
LEVTLFFLISVKSEFTLNESTQHTLFQWIFEILEYSPPRGDAMTLLYKTILTFFGIAQPGLTNVLVPYAKSLELLGFSFRALEISFQGIQMSEIASPASQAIDKIMRTSPLIGLHILKVGQAVQQLLSTPVDIVCQIRVVEGYMFLIAQSIDEDEIPQHIAYLIEAFGNVDIGSCDPVIALNILKIVCAVGKTLYTTSPSKMDSNKWMGGQGREMAEWVRGIVIVFSRRFSEDFEIMEV